MTLHSNGAGYKMMILDSTSERGGRTMVLNSNDGGRVMIVNSNDVRR